MDSFTVYFNQKYFLIVLTVLFLIAYFWFLYYFFLRKIQISKKKRKLFVLFRKITSGIKNKTITDNKQIRHIFEQSLDDIRISYSDFLMKFIVWLSIDSEQEEIDKESVNLTKSFISPILDEVNETLPYEGIPSNERLALTMIETLTAESHNKVAVKNQLISISNAIKKYNERIRDEWIINRFALFISITGILVTIGFYFWGNSSISQKSLQSIYDHTDKKIELAVDSIRSSLAPIIQENKH